MRRLKLEYVAHRVVTTLEEAHKQTVDTKSVNEKMIPVMKQMKEKN